MQKFYLRLLPYIISLFVGAWIFVAVDWITNPNWQNLALNISAGLISLPFVFICYEFVKNFSEQKIRRKIRGYILFHTKTTLWDCLKYIYCWFYPTEKVAITINEMKLQTLFDLDVQDIEKMLSEKVLLGFFVYKDIKNNMEKFSSTIKNPNINNYITNDEMIHFMDILRNITLILDEVLDFIPVGKNRSLSVKSDNNPHNFTLALYFRHIRIDSGFFVGKDKEKLLLYFKVPTELIELLSHQIVNLLADIKTVAEIMELDFLQDENIYGIKFSAK